MHKSLLYLIFLFWGFSGISQKTLTLTYIGNMGVFITDNESSVLIDGLHTKYGDDYLFPTTTLVNKINTALKPKAVLFTHRHGDHFSADLSKQYLKRNSKTLLFGPAQVTGTIGAFQDRIFTITTKDYTKQTINIGDLKITGLKINHAGKRHITVENVGYIVHLHGKKILHVGDTNWMPEIKLFDHLNLLKENIDIAILPYWMLLDENAKDLIKKYMNPKKVVATHISPRIKKEELQELKNKYPNTHFLTLQEEQIQL